MLQKLIDAVNLYRLKHSESEAIGRGVEGLSDAYANLLAVCDAAEQSVHVDDADLCDCGEPFPESGSCRFCGARSRHRQ